MVFKKIKIIPRKPGAASKWSVYEKDINDFLETLESHHVKSVAVHEKYAVIEYV